MADSFVQVPPDGSGKEIDSRTESTNGHHRQVIVVGDPATNAGVAPVSATNGLAVDAKTLAPDAATETTLAALDAKVVAVDTTDVTVTASALPTDAATQTTLAALNTKVITGVSLDYDTGAGTQAVQVVGMALPASGGAVAGGTATNPVRTDPTGTTTQPISDAGGSITIDGTVTVTGVATAANQTTQIAAEQAIQTAVEIMDDWDESDRAKVNPIVGQAGVQGNSGNVSATTQRVVLANDVALPAGTNAIGKLAANSGVDIGDVDVISLPALPAGNNNIGDVDVASLPAIPAGTNFIGNVGTGKTPKSKTGSASATFTVVAAVTSKKIKVYRLSLMTTSTTAVTVTFKDGAGGTAIGTYLLQAPSNVIAGVAEFVSIPSQLFETSAGVLLEMAFSAAQSVTYNLSYWDDDAT